MTSVAALRSMLSMPTRLYHHIRRVDDLLAADIQAAAQNPHHNLDSPSYPQQILNNLPGPWAFLTSGYAVTLLIMAILLNRIQHIVVPPRHSLVRRLTRHYTHRTRPSLLRVILSTLLPLNLSSTTARFVLRSPAIYLLWRSFVQLVIIILQCSDLFPSSQWLSSIAKWGEKTDMTEICWNIFIAVCLALSLDALIRGLEGSHSSASPFNLFGYAFLLHVYSSPITHRAKKHGGPTRPDKHVLITILIPLLQLTMLHTLSIRRKWVNQRFIPTTICGLLTLLHFHYVLMFSQTPYPLINYLPSVLETVLLAIIFLTVFLHALTQLLLEGRVTRPVLGHARTLTPRWDEEFSVAILRVGTACLEATSAAGMGNEVVGVGATARRCEPEVELGRTNLLAIRGTSGRGTGFNNEIKHVNAIKVNDSDSWIDTVWFREWGRFLRGVWGLLKGVGSLLRREPWNRFQKWWRNERSEGAVHVQPVREENRHPHREDQGEEIYQRFLRGEVVSDDDTEFEGENTEPNDLSSDCEDYVTSDSEGRETARLYADLSSSALEERGDGSTTPPPPAPMLLAHVTSMTPLTRRQYSRFLVRPEHDWESYTEERKLEARIRNVSDSDDASRKNCVVCTVSLREVICWPCRCLALCDDCRANLASRLPASKHTCPCCRRNIEGYSRIYIP